MGAQAQAVARTRQQIIDATAHRIRSSPEPLTLARVAAHAGVSRATLYRHFASVTGLPDGVAADLLTRARCVPSRHAAHDQLICRTTPSSG